MPTIFPPSVWPAAQPLTSSTTLDADNPRRCIAVRPGRPYVVRGWLSTGAWSGISATVSTAMPQTTTPFYNAASIVSGNPRTAAFEYTFITSGQVLVIDLAGATNQVLEIVVGAVTSHE